MSYWYDPTCEIISVLFERLSYSETDVPPGPRLHVRSSVKERRRTRGATVLRPKRKRGAGLHRQGKHYNRETVEVLSEQIRAVYFLYGWGNGVGPAERRIAILGAVRFRAA
eukprot:scaffold35878_cov33-Attheya_sp.AAC.4